MGRKNPGVSGGAVVVTHRRGRSRVSGIAVAAIPALVLGGLLAGCSAKPAEELWPNETVVYGEGWEPPLTALDNLNDWDDVIDVRRAQVGDEPAMVIENLNLESDVIVYYIDTRGSYQVVPIAAGATQPVAAFPRHIMRVQ